MFGSWLIQLSGGTSFGAVMVGTARAALGTSLFNNVPMAVVMISALAGIQHAPPVIQHGFITATMFGCDLGPNLTTVGSLATVDVVGLGKAESALWAIPSAQHGNTVRRTAAGFEEPCIGPFEVSRTQGPGGHKFHVFVLLNSAIVIQRRMRLTASGEEGNRANNVRV